MMLFEVKVACQMEPLSGDYCILADTWLTAVDTRLAVRIVTVTIEKRHGNASKVGFQGV